jgi:hypothetical protein
MPVLYGEGHQAFIRLQEEIVKISNDQTLLAWGYHKDMKEIRSTQFYNMASDSRETAYEDFAKHPDNFKESKALMPLESNDTSSVMTSTGLQIELPLFTLSGICFAIIPSWSFSNQHHYVAFMLTTTGRAGVFSRFVLPNGCSTLLVPASHALDAKLKKICLTRSRHLIPSSQARATHNMDSLVMKIIPVTWIIRSIYSPRGHWQEEYQTLFLDAPSYGRPRDIFTKFEDTESHFQTTLWLQLAIDNVFVTGFKVITHNIDASNFSRFTAENRLPMSEFKTETSFERRRASLSRRQIFSRHIFVFVLSY